MNLRIVSSNIRFENPADGHNDWPHRRRALSSTILRSRPHLIGTQEGRIDQLQDLESLLPDHTLIEQHRDWIIERMYPTIYMTDELSLIDSGDIWLSTTPDIPGSKSFDSAFPRLATYAHLEFNDTEFIYINLHLDHEQDQTREKQAQVLVDQIKKRFIHIPLIIGGDFNQSANGSIKKYILSEIPHLYDPWKWPEETTYHKFQGHFDNGGRIDWFLVDKCFKTLDYQIIKDNVRGLYPSDHFPIKITLEI